MTFANEQGLSSLGNNFYKPTLASGPPTQGIPAKTVVECSRKARLKLPT